MQQSGRLADIGRRMVSVDRVGGQQQLQFTGVPAERRQQRVVREFGGRVVDPTWPVRRVRRSDPVPQRRGRVRQPEMHVSVFGESAEHGQLRSRQPGRAEDRDPLGQNVFDVQHGSDHGVGAADPGHGAAPEFGLPAQVVRDRPAQPVGVVALGPRLDQLRPLRGVPAVQTRPAAGRPRSGVPAGIPELVAASGRRRDGWSASGTSPRRRHRPSRRATARPAGRADTDRRRPAPDDLVDQRGR